MDKTFCDRKKEKNSKIYNEIKVKYFCMLVDSPKFQIHILLEGV